MGVGVRVEHAVHRSLIAKIFGCLEIGESCGGLRLLLAVAQVIQDRWCGLPLNTSSADGDPAADGLHFLLTVGRCNKSACTKTRFVNAF